jgi:regulator of protease activity HflC (stomatin/prohibitin superfamily)
MGTTFFSVVGGFIILLAAVLLPIAIKIVREYQRLVVFRLGKCVGERGPGLVFLIPFIDRRSGSICAKSTWRCRTRRRSRRTTQTSRSTF